MGMVQVPYATVTPDAYIVMAYIVMACIVMAYIRARTYLPVTVAYGTCTMPIWLTTTCPETPIVTLWDVLESGNAKNRVNLTCSVCARCGDEVLCGAENAVLDASKRARVNKLKTAHRWTPIDSHVSLGIGIEV